MGYDRYAYVENNPIMKTDPSGHCPTCIKFLIELLTKLIVNDIKDGTFDTPSNVRTVVSASSKLLSNPFTDNRDGNLTRQLENVETGGIPDVTDWLVDAMIENASGPIASVLKDARSGGADGKIAAYLGFSAMVRGEAPWDYKEDFGRRSIKEVVLGGRRVNMDVVANIHYGFVGSAIGFSDEELYLAAGVAQVLGERSSLSYWSSNFDQPRDQMAIWIGIMLYQKYLLELTPEKFNKAIDDYGNNIE